MVWGLVEGFSVFNLICMRDFLGCWIVDYEDRSPRCRSFFSIGGRLSWLASHCFFLRLFGVSTSCSCLLIAQSSR
ncbi:hypothetical protein RND81_01G014500 [Saponaria officinalis]